MDILAWDLETTIKKSYKRVANCFDADNYVVAPGWSINGGKPEGRYFTGRVDPDEYFPDLTNVTLIVGVNIKFDLLWAWESKKLQAFLKRGGQIWDCQYSEYLMDGGVQSSHMLSMDEMADRYYEGGGKIDAVKEMWAEGINTCDIPKDLLMDYLLGDGDQIVGDINNTWRIFTHQIKRATEEMHPNFLAMQRMRFDGLLATTEIEYNGLYVNREVGEAQREELAKDLAAAEEVLREFIPELPPELEFNWNSIYHKSSLLYGGTVKYKKWTAHLDDDGKNIYCQKDEKWPLFNKIPVDPAKCIKKTHKQWGEVMLYPHEQGKIKIGDKTYIMQDRFKGGKNAGKAKTKIMKVPDTTKPKGALQDYYFTFPGYTTPKDSWKSEVTDAFDNPIWGTGGDIIEELTKHTDVPFLKALGDRVGLAKILGTYYWEVDKKGNKKGMLTLVGDDGIIHHKLNHTSTVTTRMSSSDPNLQNVPRADTAAVKLMFESRFGKQGSMSEIDYSQLEVVVMGVLSGDKQLTADLQSRVDFHCKRVAAKLAMEYEEVWKLHHVEHDEYIGSQRTNAKSFSFQRAYGAGAKAIAADTGIPLDEIEALIVAEEAMYPGVVQFDKNVEKSIIKTRTPSGEHLYVDGVQYSKGRGHWDSPTGTRFCWHEGITPKFMHKHGKFTGFSPTERKNYPVQGVGGEMVQAMLGKVFRYFLANDRFGGKILMVNTVHDCVWFDGITEMMHEHLPKIQALMETIPEVYNEAFPNMNIVVPFPAETEIGPNMYDMSVLKAA